jgi:hypothetical protein
MMPRPTFEIYSDPKGKNPLKELASDRIVKAGEETLTQKIYVKNISANELRDFTLSSSDPDLSFQPKIIPFMDVARTLYEVTVIWSPSKHRDTALSTMLKAEYDVIKRVS